MRASLLRGAAAIAFLGSTALSGCEPNVLVETSGTSAGTGAPGGGGEGGGGAGGAAMGSGGSSSSGQPGTCTDNADCNGGAEPFCNPETGLCVACLPLSEPAVECGVGSYCNAENQCVPGCTGVEDCPLGGGGLPLDCDLKKNTCLQCTLDQHCAPGSICLLNTCVPGCDLDQPCTVGFTCCGQICVDVFSDINHCGICDFACPNLPNAQVGCTDGLCGLAACDGDYADCNGEDSDGCEHNVVAEGPCACAPGATQSCYTGSPGTAGVGACKAGQQQCNADGVSWGPCDGQVLPAPEDCFNNLDDDCDGMSDEPEDLDGDGWSMCDADCNDQDDKINPGAAEMVKPVLVDDDSNPNTPPVWVEMGNGVDDDCNPATLDATTPTCINNPVFSSVTPLGLAQAFDICQTTTLNPPQAQRTWGLLSAEFVRPDGMPVSALQLAGFQNTQAAVLANYGAIVPKKGATFAGLSTGIMRDEDDPGFVATSPGTDLGWIGSPPAAYLAVHGGVLPSSGGCSGNCPSGSGGYDGVSLRLTIRVPTNATFFTYNYRFFSAEYPGNVCTATNDFHLSLFTTQALGIPADKNIAFDLIGNPLSVNSGFFDVCQPAGCFTCPGGADDLMGTGMPGGTSWLTIDAPIVPGEDMELELMVFDVSNATGDTVVIADHFRWGPATPPIWPK